MPEQQQNTWTELANPGVGHLPVYEPGRPLEEVARELGLGSVDEIVKLASNENALGPSPRAVSAMETAVRTMHRYPDGSTHDLRTALASKLQVQPDEVVLGNGSNELIELLAHVFLSRGDDVVFADRAFIVYRLVAAAAEARSVAVPMRELTHDLGAMLAAITPSTRLVFISNPNNPTGTMVDGAALDAFVEAAPPYVVVVIDEAYVELLPEERRPDTLRYVREGRRVILLRTFSKAYGLAGLRVGYAVGPAEAVGLLHRVRQPFNVNGMAQAAALAALDDQAHLEQTQQLVVEGLAFLAEGFAARGLSYVPSVANFMLVRVGEGRKVFEALLRRRVIVRPMDVYDLPEYVRVTLGTRAENERLMEALDELLREKVVLP